MKRRPMPHGTSDAAPPDPGSAFSSAPSSEGEHGQSRPVDAAASLFTGFVGRDAEMTLSARLDRACGGIGSVLLLAGEPWVGKTRMAEEFALLARSRGCLVAWAALRPRSIEPGWRTSSFPSGPLTPREVLRLLASGPSDQEIAATLVISVHTVERHLANIYAKDDGPMRFL